MSKYFLTAITVLIYALLTVWRCIGITGSELAFGAAAFYIVPAAVSFAAGFRLHKNRLSILPIIIAAAGQIVLHYAAFRNFKPVMLAVPAAAASAGFLFGAAWARINQRQDD